MDWKPLSIPGIVEITPTRLGDARGYFSEVFRKEWLPEGIGFPEFIQENQSFNSRAGTIRGLHIQTSPHPQDKLVRCLSGAIFDVAVDIRAGSSTFGKWVSAVLSADTGNQLWIPRGFLHGFCTLEPEVTVCYKVTSYFNSSCDAGVAWDDPQIGIGWPDIASPATLSNKDMHLPRLREFLKRSDARNEEEI